MHLLPSVAIQPNLEWKTWHKQLLGSLPLVITLPDTMHTMHIMHTMHTMHAMHSILPHCHKYKRNIFSRKDPPTPSFSRVWSSTLFFAFANAYNDAKSIQFIRPIL